MYPGTAFTGSVSPATRDQGDALVCILGTISTSVADPDPWASWIRIRRIHMFLGLLDPDPLVRGTDADPSIIRQKQ